jgi:hypothetical protein
VSNRSHADRCHCVSCVGCGEAVVPVLVLATILHFNHLHKLHRNNAVVGKPFPFARPLVSSPELFKSQNQSYLTTDCQSASLSWCQATIKTRSQFLFLLEIFFRQLRVCYFVVPSLTRGRVCNLLLLLVLASAVPLRSESRGTQSHILLSQFLRLPQPRGPGPCICIPQEQNGPDIPPGTGFPFRRLIRLTGLRWR